MESWSDLELKRLAEVAEAKRLEEDDAEQEAEAEESAAASAMEHGEEQVLEDEVEDPSSSLVVLQKQIHKAVVTRAELGEEEEEEAISPMAEERREGNAESAGLAEKSQQALRSPQMACTAALPRPPAVNNPTKKAGPAFDAENVMPLRQAPKILI